MDILSNTITFSLYGDEDHKDFLACINDFYAGGYPYGEYLDREYLRRMTEAGEMIITLAKDGNGRIVGTSAACRMQGRFAGSILLLLRSVVKDMRGKGIGGAQELFLLEQIRLHFPQILSLYADVMTHDAVSQTTMTQRGFVFCGLRMTLYKNEIIVPHLVFERGTKMTQAIYCKRCGSIPPRLLFAPSAHREQLSAIYSSLGVSVEFPLSDVPQQGKSRYELQISALHQKAELFVDRHGDTADFTAELGALIASGYTAVAYINMSVAGCEATYCALRGLGFYFSGVKPLSEGGEYLVLSHSRQCRLIAKDIKIPDSASSLYQTIVKESKYEA